MFVTTRSAVGSYKRGEAVNAVANHRAIGFYLGDDCHADMMTHMSHAPEQLEKIQQDGLIVDGKHVEIKFWFGGNLKFITVMLALSGNSSIHPCPFCLVCDRKDNE